MYDCISSLQTVQQHLMKPGHRTILSSPNGAYLTTEVHSPVD